MYLRNMCEEFQSSEKLNGQTYAIAHKRTQNVVGCAGIHLYNATVHVQFKKTSRTSVQCNGRCKNLEDFTNIFIVQW